MAYDPQVNKLYDAREFRNMLEKKADITKRIRIIRVDNASFTDSKVIGEILE